MAKFLKIGLLKEYLISLMYRMRIQMNMKIVPAFDFKTTIRVLVSCNKFSCFDLTSSSWIIFSKSFRAASSWAGSVLLKFAINAFLDSSIFPLQWKSITKICNLIFANHTLWIKKIIYYATLIENSVPYTSLQNNLLEKFTVY